MFDSFPVAVLSYMDTKIGKHLIPLGGILWAKGF